MKPPKFFKSLTFLLSIASLVFLAPFEQLSGQPAVSAGGNHSLFIKQDGSLWAMGINSSGQLGDGTNGNKSTPVQIESSGVTHVSAGVTHSLYVKNGSLFAMGDNQYGQLGDGTTDNNSTPQQIVSSGVTGVAAGAYPVSYTHLRAHET